MANTKPTFVGFWIGGFLLRYPANLLELNALNPAATTKRLWLIVTMAAALLLGWLAVRGSEPAEPSYQGRTLTQWLSDYAAGGEEYPNPRATEQAVKAIGTNAIPCLLKLVRCKDSPTQLRLNSLLDRQHCIRFRIETARQKQELATIGFRLLGNNGRPAVPALIQLMQSEDLGQRFVAMDCLLSMDHGQKDLLAVIIQSLQNPHRDVQSLAASYLQVNYPKEAEGVGIYNMFPEFEPYTGNPVETNSLANK